MFYFNFFRKAQALQARRNNILFESVLSSMYNLLNDKLELTDPRWPEIQENQSRRGLSKGGIVKTV